MTKITNTQRIQTLQKTIDLLMQDLGNVRREKERLASELGHANKNLIAAKERLRAIHGAAEAISHGAALIEALR